MKQLIEAYLARCRKKKVAAATLTQYRRVLERFADSVHFPAAGSAVDAYVASLPLSPASIRLHVAVLGGFYAWAVRNHYADANPIKDDVAAPKVVRTLPRVADASRVKSVVYNAQITLEARVVVGLGFYCGLRCSEIARLRVDAITPQIDGDRITAEIRLIGKGGKERVVIAGSSFAPLLLEYARSRTSPFLFGARNGINEATIWRWVHKYLGTNPHSLRHAMGVEAARAGAPVAVIAQVLGHSNLTTTMRYMNMAGKDREALAEAI